MTPLNLGRKMDRKVPTWRGVPVVRFDETARTYHLKDGSVLTEAYVDSRLSPLNSLEFYLAVLNLRLFA